MMAILYKLSYTKRVIHKQKKTVEQQQVITAACLFTTMTILEAQGL